MDVGKLRIFQYEVARQCRFAMIAAEDIQRSLNDLAKIQVQLGNVPIPGLEMSFRPNGDLQSLVVRAENPTPADLRYEYLDRFWYSVQAFLIAASNIAKLLHKREDLQKSLGVDDTSPLIPPAAKVLKDMRGDFEHYYDKIERFSRSGVMLVDSCIGKPTASIKDYQTIEYMRIFDVYTYEVSFQNNILPLKPIIGAITVLEPKALAEVGKSLPKMVKG